MKNSTDYCQNTQNALERFLCGHSLAWGCRKLGYTPNKQAMLGDILHERWGHVSATTVQDVHRRLGLTRIQDMPTRELAWRIEHREEITP